MMSMSTGLARLGSAIKAIGYLWIAVAVLIFLLGTHDHYIEDLTFLGIFGGIPAAAFLTIGWIIQGFAKPS